METDLRDSWASSSLLCSGASPHRQGGRLKSFPHWALGSLFSLHQVSPGHIRTPPRRAPTADPNVPGDLFYNAILVTVLAGTGKPHTAKEPPQARRESSQDTTAPGTWVSPPSSPRTLPDIFFLVLLCDRNISAIRFQFMLENPPKSIVLHTESVVQHRGDIILSVRVRTEDGCQLELCYHAAVNKH